MNPFEFIDAVGQSKKDLIRSSDDPESTAKNYNPWLINKHFSYFVDSVLYANDMNLLPHLDPLLQQDYFISTLRPKKRFAKWHKQESDEAVRALCFWYKVNPRRAREIARVLPREEVESIIRRSTVGVDDERPKGKSKRE